jgi:uncharacterized protein (TIGR03546 family)
MSLHRWFQEHSLRLLAIRDSPDAIARGVAIGIFFGFTPLIGLKTLSAIFLAWLTRSNVIAAVIAGALHDLILPFMPVIYIGEYKIGYWLLNDEWPQHFSLSHARLKWAEWWNWTTFLTVGKPLLLGSLVYGTPVAFISFVITKIIVSRHQRRKQAQAEASGG